MITNNKKWNAEFSKAIWCSRHQEWWHQSLDIGHLVECPKCFAEKMEKLNKIDFIASKHSEEMIITKKSKAWVGNQYYDPKKGWVDGKKPHRISLSHNNWLWYLLTFVLLSIIITLTLNYFYPGIKVAILGW